MLKKFCVTLTHALNDPDKATVAFILANAALSCNQETMIFLTVEGVRLAEKGCGENILVEGLPPLKELIDVYQEGGGKILVCTPCFRKRNLSEELLLPNATLAGGASLVAFLSEGASSISM